MSVRTALSDSILLKVDKAARYIGNEINSVVKDKAKVAIRVAMCFPDVYEIGMSHLGMQILYDMWNAREDTWCERVYSPWPDLHRIMKEDNIPLFALESQEPVKSFDFLGITLMYEMCYTNILQLIDLAGMPLLARDRGEDCPIVMGGGACTYNPEPVAPFFDFIYLGEGEVQYDRIFDLYAKMKKDGVYSKQAFLHEAAKIPGVYVPAFYETKYNNDGTIASFSPIYDDIPNILERQVAPDLDSVPYPHSPVIPHVRAVQDRAVCEVQRGCIRGCRFCQAGMTYRPKRERSLQAAEKIAVSQLESTGYDELSLSSLSTSDYSALPELMDFLISYCDEKHINISLPSLRIDAFSLDVMSKVQDIKKSSLTFAPEAGSQRLRNVINKGLSEDDILSGAEKAFTGGWNKVKLYFMLGLPTETEEDRLEIMALADRIAALYYDCVPKEKRNGRVNVNVSTSFFVPKPFTPFQWCRMYEPKEYNDRARAVNASMKEQLNHKSLSYSWHDAETTVIEGLLALGDRRIAPVIQYVYEHGEIFDAWTEYFDYSLWMEALSENGLDKDFYIGREKPTDEILPWDFIDTGVSRRFLEKEWERAKSEVVTPDCAESCSGCGCKRFSGGICVEERL